ncbi:MAG: type II toxin-antitoxin system RelE/ParE family toxin [Candidatus Rifleibacteriota bacterium]
MKISFHPEAEKEFDLAIDYYEDCELGLGQDFSIEVLNSIQAIFEYPLGWPVIEDDEDDIRRCLVNRFPFGIVYIVEENEIFILSVMHLRRNPDHWKKRK